MNILVIGSGGREHALAWKFAQSRRAHHVFVAPGNAGTASEPSVTNVSIAVDNIDGLVAFAVENQVDLTVVGPEAPLVDGVADAFTAAGLRCFGPTKAAAKLEASKAFAKAFLARYDIPTAQHEVFTDVERAMAYLDGQDLPIVIKADGLAGGKGVVLAETRDEAAAAVYGMLAGNSFGAAGHRVVIEEFLRGEEASFIVMVDGEHVLPMASSQDHKARDDGDTGPNTGGMGAYSPAPVVTPELHARILRSVIKPTVRGMAAEGHPYLGFLYAGLMIGADGVPRVLEYNCRLGDPETQPIMLRLRSDLIDLCESALEGQLDRVKAEWDSRVALGVVMTASGYPGAYSTGDIITGLPGPNQDGAKIFHSGTVHSNGDIVTNGGRVLCATALGDTAMEAQRSAYDLANRVHWNGVRFRTDIGYRAIARERKRSH